MWNYSSTFYPIYIQIGLEKGEADKNVKVTSFDVTEGSKKGDNFACVMKVIFTKPTAGGHYAGLLLLTFRWSILAAQNWPL